MDNKIACGKDFSKKYEYYCLLQVLSTFSSKLFFYFYYFVYLSQINEFVQFFAQNNKLITEVCNAFIVLRFFGSR